MFILSTASDDLTCDAKEYRLYNGFMERVDRIMGLSTPDTWAARGPAIYLRHEEKTPMVTGPSAFFVVHTRVARSMAPSVGLRLVPIEQSFTISSSAFNEAASSTEELERVSRLILKGRIRAQRGDSYFEVFAPRIEDSIKGFYQSKEAAEILASYDKSRRWAVEYLRTSGPEGELKIQECLGGMFVPDRVFAECCGDVDPAIIPLYYTDIRSSYIMRINKARDLDDLLPSAHRRRK